MLANGLGQLDQFCIKAHRLALRGNAQAANEPAQDLFEIAELSRLRLDRADGVKVLSAPVFGLGCSGQIKRILRA